MRYFSGTGDRGETSTLNGGRVSKNNVLIHFEGAADELNSQLGLVKVLITDADICNFIERIQKTLMIVMSHVSDSSNTQYLLQKDEIDIIENEIGRLSLDFKNDYKFVLPGKSIVEAQIHIARAAARKAERMLVAVCEQMLGNKALCPNALVFLNRLSSYLFVLSQAFDLKNSN
jgi:cob(I)alamin adenosyltransferase